MQFAGFWIRLLAGVIDLVLMNLAAMVAGGIAGGVLGGIMGAGGAGEAEIIAVATVVGQVLGLLVGIAYFALQEASRHQATLGKRLCGIVVCTQDGARIGLGRAVLRYLAAILSASLLFIGMLMIAFTARKQGLHDMMTGTVVVRKDSVMRAPSAVFE